MASANVRIDDEINIHAFHSVYDIPGSLPLIFFSLTLILYIQNQVINSLLPIYTTHMINIKHKLTAVGVGLIGLIGKTLTVENGTFTPDQQTGKKRLWVYSMLIKQN